MELYTLQGTNISPQNGILKMIFLFPRWDMLIPWRVTLLITSELIHKTEPWRWNTTCFRSSAWPKSPCFWVASLERGAAVFWRAISRKGWRGWRVWVLGLGLAIFCLFFEPKKAGGVFFPKLLVRVDFLSNWIFLWGKEDVHPIDTPAI